jgi:hypothetical protein
VVRPLKSVSYSGQQLGAKRVGSERGCCFSLVLPETRAERIQVTAAKSSWVTLRARWVTLRARWVTLRARWVTLGAR